MVKIHVWQEDRKGWFWDDAEDHGGFDRCVPSGPFDTKQEAITDADMMFDLEATEFYEITVGTKPSYYSD